MEVGIIILILLLCVLVACIVAAFVSKEKDPGRDAGYGSGPHSLTSTMRRSISADASRTHDVYMRTELETNQVTICGHRSAGPVCLCPVCDGENPPSAAHCHICGRQLH